MNTMGKRIYMKRTENGMTMKQLADRLGVQTSAINKYEKGAVENIKRKTIEDMAKIFGCSPSWLKGEEKTAYKEFLKKLNLKDNPNSKMMTLTNLIRIVALYPHC